MSLIGKTISHYKILEELGRGGMGVVYKAEDSKLERKVALKFLPPHYTSDAELNKRFRREAKAAAALNHPNIITVYEIGEHEGRTYIAMEYVDGESLRERVSSGQLSVNSAVGIATQICNGLNAAHQAGVIHRDIKPENIIVDKTGRVRILDFGLARMSNVTKLTKESTTLGTISYMSPEQFSRPGGIDHRADIWAVGVVLYEMLAGELPFQGEYEQAVMYSVCNEEPEPIQNERPDIPPYFADIISRCLEKNPADRFQSMGEIIEALAEEMSISAKPIAPDKGVLKHNLPAQMTSFVGREREKAEVKKLLGEYRVVTVAGAGGCGKTRLALQVASEIVHEYQDGVWLVELASLSKAEQVPESVAGVFNIKTEPNTPLIETLANQLKAKNVLLLLDNCEHLIATCSELAEILLRTAPDLAILATSREALNIAGEMAWGIPSLALPQEKQLPEIKNLPDYEAIQLFVERASTSRPAFSLTSQNAASIVHICRRLDGIPLAIELAAARMKLLQPDDILKRLDNRFQLLTGGRRTALERQKTLRATVDWSYDLLSDAEKLLFNRLSVFVGGCDLDAAETVCGRGSLSPEDILDILAGLADKSLIISDAGKESAMRYRLLETLRHYAGEKLYQSEEAAQIRDEHFEYYLALAEEAYANRLGDEKLWADRLETEHDNLLAALQWVHDKPEQQLILAGALGWFWYSHSHFHTGTEFLTSAIKHENGDLPAYARALFGMGQLSIFGNSSEGISHFEKSLAVWRKVGNQREIGLVLLELGQAQLFYSGDHSTGIRNFEESIQIFRNLKDDKLTLKAESNLSYHFIVNFNAEKAEPLVLKNLELAQKWKMPVEVTLNRHLYGDCALIKENYIDGERRYANALKAALDMGDIFQATIELQGLAMSVGGQKRYTKAVRLNAAAMQKFEELGIDISGVEWWDVLLSKTIGTTQKALGKKATAIAENEGREMGFEKAAEYALDFENE